MTKITENIPWIEKYRPRNLENICYQDDVIMSITQLIKNNSIPHLLFFGPPGTGKTSTILAICRKLFTPELWRERVLEFNASDDRGIKFIRDIIKKETIKKLNHNNKIQDIKIIILDEVDTLTMESQYALRRVIENCSKNVRFCLICNYPNKLIDPIISRCAQYRFKPIISKIIKKQFNFILKNENIPINKDINKKIVEYSRGDLRMGISLLQRYYVNKESEELLFGEIHKTDILYILNLALHSKDKELISFFKKYFFSGISLVSQIKLLLEYVSLSSLEDSIKSNIILDIIQIDNYLVNGGNDYLLYHFLTFSLIKHINKK